MDSKFKPLEAWMDDPHVSAACSWVEDGRDPVEVLVETIVGIAERARYAEDFMLIHRMRQQPDQS